MTGAWGNIPQWVSSIGGSISLILAFYIILRDRKKTERGQAASVSAWQDEMVMHDADKQQSAPGEPYINVQKVDIEVHNSSNMPITKLLLISRTMVPREIRARFTANEMMAHGIPKKPLPVVITFSALLGDDGKPISVLLPDTKAHITEKPSIKELSRRYPLNVYRRWIIFADSAGNIWCRDLNTAKLLPADSSRTRQVLRGRVLPQSDSKFELYFYRYLGKDGPLSFFTRQTILISRLLAYFSRPARESDPSHKDVTSGQD